MNTASSSLNATSSASRAAQLGLVALLGVFVVAFFFRRVGGSAVFWAAIAAQAVVIGIFFFGKAHPEWEIGYLWLNPIGCAACVLFSLLLQTFLPANHANGRE